MIISIIIFILTLLVLVIIHELGHYLAAKKFGIKVEEFGFGIPPRIIGKKIGETIYSLNALPLGGFVRLLGEDEVEKDVLKNPRSFAHQHVYKRIFVVIAGVLMNLLLAWAIFYMVIVYQNFRIIYPVLEPAVFVGFLEKDFPAEKSGVKAGDRVLQIDGKEVKKFEDVRNTIKEKKGESVDLTVANIDGKEKKVLKLTPQKVNDDFLIGIGFTPVPIKHYETSKERMFSGITYSWHLTKTTFDGLGKLFSDLFAGNFQTASQSVSGPVGLANMSSEILSGGRQALPFYLWFVGVISLTLSIFNVLPIPALDGGRLLFLVIEAITGKKVRAEVETLIHQIGFAILLGLAFLVTYSDISKLIK